ncbi:MAG: 50S ribosome-binding GTPase [Myxococcaceae bacterium]|nr:50S ribosome-binding GTPase [Myxococcaceae bacterium]
MTTSSALDGSMDEVFKSVRSKFEMTPRVAIAGFGKAGKSSLFNAIYGEARAAVSMRTDETRELQTERRFGIDFTDTPGVGTGRFSLDRVEEMAVFDRQHVVIHVLNGTTAISEEDERLHLLIERSSARRVTVVNKSDLLDERERAEFAESLREKLGLFRGDYLFISARRGINVDLMVRRVAELLPEAMQDAFIGQQRADLALKERRVRALVYAQAATCAGVALSPLPVADMAVISPLQIGMVASVGYLHGVAVSRERVLELIGVLGAGYGLREAARQLVKLVPGVGSIVSAAVAFAGTVALGEVANLWFKRRMHVPAEELQKLFRGSAERARVEYERQTQAAAERGVDVMGGDCVQPPGNVAPDAVDISPDNSVAKN